MELTQIRQLLSDSIVHERASLKAARHPQVIAGHQAAVRDFEQRLRELDEKLSSPLSA